MGRADNLPDPVEAQAARTGGNAIEHLLERGQAQLAATSTSARLDAHLLLAHVLGRSRSYLLAHPQDSVAPVAMQAYLGLLARASAGEPLAYLTGTREFWSLALTVTPAVLIPRPESELVVERALALLAPSAAATCPRVCDLGTGSGAIALALASEQPGWHISATDRSDAALQIARTNAARLRVRHIEFLQGNWFEPLLGQRFALLVSNPPYIAAMDRALAALAHEPLAALSPGATGLEALQAIISQAPAHLAPGGWLVLEHGATQGTEVARALVATGYARVRCHQDLAGRDRVTEGQWP